MAKSKDPLYGQKVQWEESDNWGANDAEWVEKKGVIKASHRYGKPIYWVEVANSASRYVIEEGPRTGIRNIRFIEAA